MQRPPNLLLQRTASTDGAAQQAVVATITSTCIFYKEHFSLTAVIAQAIGQSKQNAEARKEPLRFLQLRVYCVFPQIATNAAPQG